MRIVPFILAITLLRFAVDAAEIRQFDLKTIERLGNELTQVSQRPDRGATTAAKKRAKQTAMTALQGKLFNVRYDYVVLDDPERSGSLVYALGTTKSPNEVVLAGHFRVTVSADGEKAERVDALSRSLVISGERAAPAGTKLAGMYMAQLVSTKPLETLIYTSNLTKLPIVVPTPPNGQVWHVENGRITKSNK